MISVLLADDHEIVRTGVRLVLEQQPDIEVRGEVGSGRELAAALERDPADIVLLDITLGDDDGIALIDLIRLRWPSAKVVALTMHDDIATVRQALSAGAHGYVVKGARSSELLEAIRVTHADGAYIHPAVAMGVVKDAVRGGVVAELLSPRENQVLRLLAGGGTTRTIATALGLSEHTINRHISNAIHKLGARDRAELLERTRDRFS
ncbi:MAG: response regulator transcription factor [Chloroflexota bacterium]